MSLRRPDLLDAAVVEDRDPVRHRQRLALVVRDEHEGYAERVLQALQLALHRLPQLEVERAERLVEQEDLGAHDERARERHPLPLSARKLAGLAHLHADELDELQGLGAERDGARTCRTPRIISP